MPDATATADAVDIPVVTKVQIVERPSRVGLRLLGLALFLGLVSFLLFLAVNRGYPASTRYVDLVELMLGIDLVAAACALLGFLHLHRRAPAAKTLGWFGLFLCLAAVAGMFYYYPQGLDVDAVMHDVYGVLLVAGYGLGLVLLTIGHYFVRGIERANAFVERATPPPAVTGRRRSLRDLIGPTAPQVEAFHNLGIRDTGDLLLSDPYATAPAVGMSLQAFLDLQSQADLLRLSAMDPKTAQRCVEAGIYGLEQLGADPAILDPQARAFLMDRELDAYRVRWQMELPWMTRTHVPLYLLPRHHEQAPLAVAPPIEDIRGIGQHYRSQLEAAGVHDAAALLADDPQTLSNRTGVPLARVRRWQAIADLERVPGLQPEAAALLEERGIRSVGQLARTDPDDLVHQLGRGATSRRWAALDVGPEAVRHWIEEAHRLSAGAHLAGPPTAEGVAG